MKTFELKGTKREGLGKKATKAVRKQMQSLAFFTEVRRMLISKY